MKRFLMLSMMVIMLLSMTAFSTPVFGHEVTYKSGPQTYTVYVGAENTRQGISLMAFFPDKLRIHVGDTVVWKANTHEIHTVSFLAPGMAVPEFTINAPAGAPSPVQINPLAGFPAAPADGVFDPSVFINSGIMSTDPGNVPQFSLTFNQAGTFQYVCIVHGMMMSATIEVVDSGTPAPSPRQARRTAFVQMAKLWSKAPQVLKDAFQAIEAPTQNSDGTTTYHVMVGWSEGQIDVMRFFPRNLAVRPGDTVEWSLSSTNIAPHNIAFYNGHPDNELVTVVPQPSGPPLLLLNPAIVFPSQAVLNGTPLNSTDFFNSGLLVPGSPNTSFTTKVGDVFGRLSYECDLHESSGMKGSIYVRQFRHED